MSANENRLGAQYDAFQENPFTRAFSTMLHALILIIEMGEVEVAIVAARNMQQGLPPPDLPNLEMHGRYIIGFEDWRAHWEAEP